MRLTREPPAGPPGAAPADDADPVQVARTIALRRLTAAPRTRADLRADLVARGVTPSLADEVVDRFTEVGLLDDAEYARMWVESRHRTRGTARSVLRQELRHKGVDDDAANAALAQIDGEGERERARQLVERKLAGRSAIDEPDRLARRLAGMLVRRGYRTAMAYEVVREALADTDLLDAHLPEALDTT